MLGCCPQFYGFTKQIGALMDRGLQFPNVLFVFNTEDNLPRWCGPSGQRNCTVPLISLIKTVDALGNDTDILVPQSAHVAE